MPGEEEGLKVNGCTELHPVDLDELVVAGFVRSLRRDRVEYADVATSLDLRHGAPLLTHATAVNELSISACAPPVTTVILRA